MFTMYNEMVTGPGRLEGESPMVAYLDNLFADNETGDVESPTGYVRRYGKWVLRDDSNGFVHGLKLLSVDAAERVFDVMAREFDAWSATDYCPRCERDTTYDGENCSVCGREWGSL